MQALQTLFCIQAAPTYRTTATGSSHEQCELLGCELSPYLDYCCVVDKLYYYFPATYSFAGYNAILIAPHAAAIQKHLSKRYRFCISNTLLRRKAFCLSHFQELLLLFFYMIAFPRCGEMFRNDSLFEIIFQLGMVGKNCEILIMAFAP